jgi:F-type H+-transporting ATPase subunit beta
MIEAGIIKYGDEFKHSMEEGGWDLSKVDKEGKEIKSYFRFRSNERTSWSTCSCCFIWFTIAEYFRDGDGTDQGKDIFSSLIISSVLHKLVLRYRHF